MHFPDDHDTSEERSINAPEYEWINADGELYSMCEMDLNYLGNCLRMVQHVRACCNPKNERAKKLIDACDVKLKEFENVIDLLNVNITKNSPRSSNQAKQKMSLEIFDITERDLPPV